jgi:hypothetical protein
MTLAPRQGGVEHGALRPGGTVTFTVTGQSGDRVPCTGATLLRSSANPVAPNDWLTFSATLVPTNHDVFDVTGSVTFFVGDGTVSCAGGNVAALVSDVATCSVPAGTLTVLSSYAVSATYAGSGDYDASSAALTDRTSNSTA